MIFKAHPDVQLRSDSARYNCVGMVFAHRRAWVEDTEIRALLKQDGYRRLPNFSALMDGDVVVYCVERGGRLAASHVAVMVRRVVVTAADEGSGIVVLSKWGNHGEYVHRMEDVHPALGRPAEFWSEREQS